MLSLRSGLQPTDITSLQFLRTQAEGLGIHLLAGFGFSNVIKKSEDL